MGVLFFEAVFSLSLLLGETVEVELLVGATALS